MPTAGRIDAMTEEKDREFRRRLNEARAHFGTATTQTNIPDSQRWASQKKVLDFFDSLDPDRLKD